jgi:hypothetical protein
LSYLLSYLLFRNGPCRWQVELTETAMEEEEVERSTKESTTFRAFSTPSSSVEKTAASHVKSEDMGKATVVKGEEGGGAVKGEAECQKSLQQSAPKSQFPVVQFCNGMSHVVVPVSFESTLFKCGTARREQVPLRLAWALTIHKSQGQTLDKVQVSLEGCFERGQAYVALSRARSVQGLQVKGFNVKRVKTDALARDFHAALSLGDAALVLFLQHVPMWCVLYQLK